MYDFMDRPVTSLDRGGRIMVWAMRHWVMAASAGRCPCAQLGPAFRKWDLMPGFPHFHMMMAVLNGDAIEKLRFGTLDCARVSEHEALLIGLVRGMRARTAQSVAGAAALIVRQDAVANLVVAMGAFSQALADAKLSPAVPIHDSESTRFPDE